MYFDVGMEPKGYVLQMSPNKYVDRDHIETGNICRAVSIFKSH